MTTQLIHGDCLEVMPTLPAQTVHLTVADLPYGVTSCKWDTKIDIDAFWRCLKILGVKKNIVALTAINPFSSVLVASNLAAFRYDLIWQKNSASGFLSAKYRPLRAHEHILIFSTGKTTYNPQMTEGVKYSHSAITRGRETYATQNYQNRIAPKTARYPLSVQAFGVARYTDGRFHPTQKPIALLEWLIKTYTNPGDTVLDPVMGSASTGVACLRTGRKFIGIEKDATYFAAAQARIAAEQTRLVKSPNQALLPLTEASDEI